MAKLMAIKPLKQLMAEAHEEGEHSLKRALGPINLMTLGIGAIIGTGIFVLVGPAAARYAGPAVALSFVVAGITCAFAALCYSEFAAMIPIAGSAYSYGYATLGEFVAWMIGWDLVLEYAFGAATVASGWSGYFLSMMDDIGIHISPRWTASPGTDLYQYHGHWVRASALIMDKVDPATLPHVTTIANLVAFLAIAIVTIVLIIGIKESANLNSVIVAVKIGVVFLFIGLGTYFLMQHHELVAANWHPFIPPNTGGTHYGIPGIMAGAASVFFAYIGFDAVSTAAQEARNPQRDMPIGIIGSLIACTILYIIVALVLTGLVPYSALDVGDPIVVGIRATHHAWGALLVEFGAVCGLGTTMLVMLFGQSRVFFSMGRDGLVWPWASKISPRTRTPYISNIVFGLIAGIMPALLPVGKLAELVNMGTLLAFAIVCAGVWILRVRHPELHRPFKCPWVPVVPILGICTSLYLVWTLPMLTKEVVFGWLLVGLVVYFTYSIRHSKVQQAIRAGAVVEEA
jgi:APA family basic amino acid/polyamine antiporter